jgi:hypothetical protein
MKQTSDDLLKGWVFDGHIIDGVIVENLCQDS